MPITTVYTTIVVTPSAQSAIESAVETSVNHTSDTSPETTFETITTSTTENTLTTSMTTTPAASDLEDAISVITSAVSSCVAASASASTTTNACPPPETPDIVALPAYIIVMVIPLMFVIVALRANWLERHYRLDQVRNSAANEIELEEMRRYWFPWRDALDADELYEAYRDESESDAEEYKGEETYQSEIDAYWHGSEKDIAEDADDPDRANTSTSYGGCHCTCDVAGHRRVPIHQ